MGISRKGWSERLEKQAVKLGARGSFGEAVETYADLVGLELPKTTIWERTQERGRKLKEKRGEEAEKAWEIPSRQTIMAGEAKQELKKAVTMDGVLVYIQGEEWKEVKVGCVFEYETGEVYCRKTKEMREVAKAKNQTYTAHLGGREPFGKLLSAEAERRDYDSARDQVSIGDGAKWIWNLTDLCFPTARQIVDWYHAVEHLWSVANLVYGEGDARARRWAKRREDDLWLGKVHSIVSSIEALAEEFPDKAEEIRKEAGYFRNNARRMNYQEFREEEHPIGSGTVEGGCKNLVSRRMKGPGMRWSRNGAENVLALRAEYLSGRWDEGWLLTLAA